MKDRDHGLYFTFTSVMDICYWKKLERKITYYLITVIVNDNIQYMKFLSGA